MADVNKVTEAFAATYKEMIDEMKRTNIIANTQNYCIPTPREFYEAATEHDLERYVVANDSKAFDFLDIKTLGTGRRVHFRKDQAFPTELFLYLKNLLLLSATLNSEVDFGRLQRNLQNLTEAHEQSNVGLMSVIEDVKSELVSKIPPEQLTSRLSNVDITNPTQILSTLQTSGVDIMGIVDSVSRKLNGRMERGEFNEADIQNMMNSLLQQPATRM